MLQMPVREAARSIGLRALTRLLPGGLPLAVVAAAAVHALIGRAMAAGRLGPTSCTAVVAPLGAWIVVGVVIVSLAARARWRPAGLWSIAVAGALGGVLVALDILRGWLAVV